MSVMNTMRITKFGGLNKSVNPHNIKDNEMVEMENLFVTKSGTLESRKGHQKIGVTTDYTYGLWTTAWSPTDERLYYQAGSGFNKMVGSTGTSIAAYPGSAGVNALRYKDKMLFLGSGDYLRWYGSTESLELARYPEFQVSANDTQKVTAIADHDAIVGAIEVDQTYQYSVSFRLGANGKDGETANALPSTAGFLGPSQYAYGTAATGLQILKGADVDFVCADLHGFTLDSVRLWARKAHAVPTGISGSADDIVHDGSWQLLDEVWLTKVGDNYIASGTGTFGVITAATGTYSSTYGYMRATLTWEHFNPDVFVDEVPYESVEVVNPKAKFMTRLHNRIFLANIITNSPQDCKKVYMSYRGLINLDGTLIQEIGGYTYPDPMIIFPQLNYFFCDAEDTEDPITATHAYQNNVMIFTKRCSFIWREGMGEPIKLSNEIGCIANDTIREFEGKLVWLARNGIYMFDGSNIENITWSKVHSYIDDMRNDYASRSTAAVYDRKYFITAPFESSNNDLVLVYDFDLKQWHVRRYKADDGTQLCIHRMYVDYDGNDETLYFGGAGTTGASYLGTLEDGYGDESIAVAWNLKTKYFDFGAPDIYKIPRASYINIENYFGNPITSVYIDNLNEAVSTITHVRSGDGLIVNSDTQGVISGVAITPVPTVMAHSFLKNLSDELIATSLNRGLQGSRIQFSASGTAYGAPMRIHMIGFEWVPTTKLKRKYGA